MALGIFLLGEDHIEDVRKIRNDALAALSNGSVVSWSTDAGASVQKVVSLPLEKVIEECNYFMRRFDPKIRKTDPIRTRTRPFLV